MKTVEELREYLVGEEMNYTVYFENPSYVGAIVGVSDDDRLIYDYEKMIDCLIEEDGMTEDEAVEFIDYNTLGALGNMGDHRPIILNHIIE